MAPCPVPVPQELSESLARRPEVTINPTAPPLTNPDNYKPREYDLPYPPGNFEDFFDSWPPRRPEQARVAQESRPPSRGGGGRRSPAHDKTRQAFELRRSNAEDDPRSSWYDNDKRLPSIPSVDDFGEDPTKDDWFDVRRSENQQGNR